ncbi:hypothetical protein CPB86DRAFT_878739 [Serendipita vermifera]|nr:hypothetical protein CPB86DRAFT_878739 [Serendipita vermifera]
MGGWDELCLICGVKPGGGPIELFPDFGEPVNKLVGHVQQSNLDLNLDQAQLWEEIENLVLMLCGLLWDQDDLPPHPRLKLLENYGKPHYIFDSETPESYHTWDYELDNVPRGYDVVARPVCGSSDFGGIFNEAEEKPGVYIRTNASSHRESEGFFCLRNPYLYLQAWVDRGSLPPRQTAFPFEPDMSFEGELYEIVKSRQEPRKRDGTLPWIDYEGIELALNGRYQDYFIDGLRDTFHLNEALKSGLRGRNLIPALMEDFHVWQTCPPDRWVQADLLNANPKSIQSCKVPQTYTMWDKLPMEVVLKILANLSISDILPFTSSCLSFHHLFGNPAFLSSHQGHP